MKREKKRNYISDKQMGKEAETRGDEKRRAGTRKEKKMRDIWSTE